MLAITLNDIKKYGSNAIPADQVSYLIVNSKPKSAIIPIDQYKDYVDAVEELEDLKAVFERIDEENISMDDVFKKIPGLD